MKMSSTMSSGSSGGTRSGGGGTALDRVSMAGFGRGASETGVWREETRGRWTPGRGGFMPAGGLHGSPSGEKGLT
jgi:hypothetical protein